ncbi:hypothetical protein COCON_G00000870 [Conger conger]|uniref:S100P-binding protein n=1 Tax=Conger conger TaxID=82655 RepID=A0A9Q1I885_CONCO|nr:hypothetical protein COCON_G00000870 [Conger conger]
MEAERQAASALGQRPTERRESAGAFSHLRPLSCYSRKIVCDSVGGWPSFGRNLPASFCNLKIEIFNSAAAPASVSAKRPLDEASRDQGCGTPLRKRVALGPSAPDLVNIPDARGAISGKSQAPRSPVKPPNPPRLTMIRKATRGVSLGRPASHPFATGGGVLGASSRDRAGSGGVGLPETPLPRPESPPRTQTAGELDVDHAFDFDIEEILSLSPIRGAGSDDGEGIEAFIESCQSFYESGLGQDTPSHALTTPSHALTTPSHALTTPSHALTTPDHTLTTPGLSLTTPSHALTTPIHAQSLSGHALTTPSHALTTPIHAQSLSGHALTTPNHALTTPGLALTAPSHAQSLSGHALTTPDPPTPRQATPRGQGLAGRGGTGQPPEIEPPHLQSTPLALGAELHPSSNRQQVAVLGGGAWPSPAPADEPVVCRNLLPFLDDPPHPEPTGDLQGGGLGGSGLSVRWGVGVTVGSVEKNYPSPCENTPALSDIEEPPKKPCRGPALSPVQVRSVVMVPLRRAEPNRAQSGIKRIERPVVYEWEADWQREKELYVAAVSRHMDSAPSGGGAMSELVHLMKAVAREATGNGNKPWQHPSDFTRRNLRPPPGKPLLSLDEWQQASGTSFCRFANIPAKFLRSPVP